MIKKLFAFVLLGLFLLGSASAYFYDNFADGGPVNWNLWRNLTVGTGNTILEASSQLQGTANNNNDGTLQVWSENWTAPHFIKWINFTIQYNLASGAGGSQSVIYQIFNSTIISRSSNNPASLAGTEQISLYRNTRANLFEVTNGTTWLSNITGNVGRNILMSGTGTGNSPYTREVYIGEITYDTFGVWNNITSPINGTFEHTGFDNPFSFTINNTAIFEKNLTNVTYYLYRSNHSLALNGTVNITSKSNITTFNSDFRTPGLYYLSAYTCGQNGTFHVCYNSGNTTFTLGFSVNNISYNATVYETSTESFKLNVTLSSFVITSSSATFYYNGTAYSATKTTSGDNTIFSTDVTFPNVDSPSTKNFYWTLNLDGTLLNTSINTQTLSPINLTLCGAAPQNVPFINFTFRNETASQERVNASIVSSTWYYWLEGGTVNKTFSYSNSAENKEYTFCFSPQDRTFNTLLSLSYDNAESEQRTYEDSLTLTNTSTLKTLYLLPSTLGQYVTFQVINSAQSPLEGVEIVVTRSGIGTIETKTTDSTGSATLFLNPNFAYSFVFSKSGFESFTTTITPTQTSYTITLGAGATTNVTNPQAGITYRYYPILETLNNNTVYNFNFTINSTYWPLSSWGYTISNSSGFVFAQNTSTASSGGFISSTLNTGQNKSFTMNYFWVINGSYNNASVTWGIADLSDSGFSLFAFFTDLVAYVGVGFFGLDNFGLAFLTFLCIFVITGVTSYKFGINSSAAIMALVFGLVLFFDVGLGLVPNPIEAIPHAITVFAAFMFVGLLFREMGR